MQRRRVLSFALSAFFICFALCGTVSASGILTIDEMDIDPWGDLAEIQDATDPSGPVSPISADDSVYALSQSPMAVMSAAASDEVATYEQTYSVQIYSQSRLYYGTSEEYTGGRNSIWGIKELISSEPSNNMKIDLGLETLSYQSSVIFAGFLDGNPVGTGNIRFTYPIPSKFFDGDSKELSITWSPSAHFNVSTAYGLLEYYPGSYSILYNGKFYGTAKPFESVDITIPLQTGVNTITLVGWYSKTQNLQLASAVSEVTPSFQFGNLPNFSRVDPNTGLLSGILAFLQTIYNAIVSLPGNIASAIIEGLKGLFIPSEEDITGIKSQYESLFSQRLGFIYQAASWITDFAQTMLSTLQSGNTYQFTFPGVSVPLPDGTNMVLLQEQQVSLENGLMDVLRPVLGTIVSFICVVSFINMAHDMVSALISGTSYFEFMRGGKHDDN